LAEKNGHKLVHPRVGKQEVRRIRHQARRRHNRVLLRFEKIQERLSYFRTGHISSFRPGRGRQTAGCVAPPRPRAGRAYPRSKTTPKPAQVFPLRAGPRVASNQKITERLSAEWPKDGRRFNRLMLPLAPLAATPVALEARSPQLKSRASCIEAAYFRRRDATTAAAPRTSKERLVGSGIITVMTKARVV